MAVAHEKKEKNLELNSSNTAQRATTKKDTRIETVVIVGSGPAGLTAALYCARAGLTPLIILGTQRGGAIIDAKKVENWPGVTSISGAKLIDSLEQQALHHGAHTLDTIVQKIQRRRPIGFRITTPVGIIDAEAVILACGTTARRLGLPGEKKFWGRGVSTCATCDAAFYRDKIVGVVGGGVRAVQSVIALSQYAKKIYLIVRDSHLAPTVSPELKDALEALSQVTFLFSTTVKSLHGTPTESLTPRSSGLARDDEGEVFSEITVYNSALEAEKTIALDGLFLALGTAPNTEPFARLIACDGAGYALCKPGTTETSVPGIFAAGDIVDRRYHQAVTAAASGCQAALDCERYITGMVRPRY